MTLRATASDQPWKPPWTLTSSCRPVCARAMRTAYATASLPVVTVTIRSMLGTTSTTASARRISSVLVPHPVRSGSVRMASMTASSTTGSW